jgi:hypothetical protein
MLNVINVYKNRFVFMLYNSRMYYKTELFIIDFYRKVFLLNTQPINIVFYGSILQKLFNINFNFSKNNINF